MYHWARKRTGDYWHTMHEDWTLGDYQLSIKRWDTGETVLYIRKRKGRFSVSDWERALVADDKKVCDHLRFLLKRVERLDELYDLIVWRREEKEKAEKLAEYCGYDPNGKLWC
jgi:hypothetical protein